jgi:hypothetical protein
MMSEETGFKNFSRVLRDFSFGGAIDKIKVFFKQFIP